MITKFKMFENKIRLSDIYNIGLITNEKYLKIIEYYLCFDSRYINLNIPVDIYYAHGVFSKEPKYEYRHFYEISGIWSNFKGNITSRIYGEPRFIINMLSEESVEIDIPDWSEYEDRIIIRDEEKNNMIIDIIYEYVMKNQEIIVASKFNI